MSWLFAIATVERVHPHIFPLEQSLVTRKGANISVSVIMTLEVLSITLKILFIFIVFAPRHYIWVHIRFALNNIEYKSHKKYPKTTT